MATRADGAVGSAGPVFLGLRFSNLCNFRCRSCSPRASTAWHSDWRKLGLDTPDAMVKASESFEELWQQIEPLLPGLQRLYLAGGEPLLQEQHYQLLEKLIECGRTDVQLSYNSNFSTLEHGRWRATELWSHFKYVWAVASIDGVGSQGELLRKGMRWQTVAGNFERLRREAPHVHFGVHYTVSAYNPFHMTRAIEELVERGMVGYEPGTFRVNVLREPRYLNLNILNEAERAVLQDHYLEFRRRIARRVSPEFHQEIVSGLDAVLAAFSDQVWQRERAIFRNMTFKLDRIRSERVIEHFPELLGVLYEG